MREEVRLSVRKDQLLLDVSSLKTREVEAMKSGRGEVIGMHPLFGPTTDPKGETVILCPGRTSKQTLSSLRSVLKKMGMKTIVMTPEAHDTLMATVQVIPHLKSFLMADVLREQGADLQSMLRTCTPTYEMEFNVIARFLDDHPDLYMPIIFRNPKTVKILQAMHTIIGEYLTIAHSGNLTDAEKRYEASKLYFKPFLNRARKHSEACIETLLSLKG
jgi:prephenate dehydrogenase